MINNERIERKENRLSHHHHDSNADSSNDGRNSFDLTEYDGRMKHSMIMHDERTDTLRRPPNLIYSQDFSQSLNSCDPRMVYTPMTDHSNIEEDERNEEKDCVVLEEDTEVVD